jgi:hypothetical protein
MQWTKKGAHLLLQTRTQVLDGRLKRRSENGTSDFVLKLNSRPPEHPVVYALLSSGQLQMAQTASAIRSPCSDRANAQFLYRAKTLRDHLASASVRKSQDAGFPAMERLIALFIFGEVKFLPDVVELYSPRCHFLWC